MAKVNYGTIVNDARGKVNGTVFSKNKSGAYTRRKVTPANPNTPNQTLVRTNFSTLSKNWSGVLTPSDRAQWINFANLYPRNDIFGASIKISGLNMYISLNQVVLQLLGVPPADPPSTNVVVPLVFDPTSFAAAAAGGTMSFSQTVGSGGSTKFYVFAAAPTPAGRAPQQNQFRFLQAVAALAMPGSIDVGSAYAAKFGAWLINQRVSLLVATVDPATGLTTLGTVLTAIST